MKRGSWFPLVLVILFGGAAVFAPRVGWYIGETLRGGSGGAFPPADVSAVALENAALRAELETLQSAGDRFSGSPPAAIGAFVYSRYPFNLKHELLISRGSDDGVAVGDVAGLPSGSSANEGCRVLLGEVVSVSPRSAVVRTIFDPAFQIAVRIGERGVDGLFTGGAAPLVTLIPQKASVGGGAAVYAASAEAPYGMTIGQVAEVRPAADQVFRNASLEVPYDVNAVRAVCIVKPPPEKKAP